jgi:serine/threonine protein kinase
MVFDNFEQTRRHISSPYMKQIDEVCDDFEAAWQRGSRIRIESCLRLVPELARDDLLRELLENEIELRMKNGESLLLEQYAARFPKHSDLVKKILQRHSNPRRLGDYELLEQLGRGGMGIVYKARQIYLNQIVAVKILPEQYMSDDHAVTRFRREMQLIGGLKHPNIVQAYNAGETNGVHYLVMEYVAGVTLQQLIAEMEEKRRREINHPKPDQNENEKKEREPKTDSKIESSQPPTPSASCLMNIGAACETIRQAALGLHHAGQRGLVHRDIKPGNLMLDRHGVIKILDLGLGKFQADVLHNDRSFGPLTQAGTTMGTVDYMAPEQWDDPTAVDIRADIYSLGNTLYFLLHGAPPFDGKNYHSNRAKLMAHIVAEPPALTSICQDIPPELNRVYLKMAAKDPNDRFSTPFEAAEALAPFASLDALRESIPQELLNITDADQITSSEYDNSGAHDTMESYPFSPSRRKTSDQSPPHKSWYRHQEFYAVAVLVSLLLLVIAGGVIQSFWNTTTKIPPEVRVPSPQINEPSLPLRYAPTEQKNIAADLVELPGLSGSTWFSETPWFLPFVRQAAANALLQTTAPKTILGEDTKGYLNVDTVYVQNWLYALTHKILPGLTPQQQQLVRDIKTLADSNLDGAEYAARMETAYQKYTEANKNNLPISAVDKNTEAVLLHIISSLKSDREIAKQAEAKYQEALLEYPQDTVSQQLKFFCMVDYARLIGQSLLKYGEAHKIYEQVRPQVVDLLKIDISVSLGAELSGLGKYDDHPFRYAQRILKNMSDSGTIKSTHPLIAHVAERFAWMFIDQWKINDSQRQFQTALDVRKANSLESQGKHPFADIYVFHNMHGLAMTARYRGDFSGAKQKYAEIVQLIAAKLKSSEEQLSGAEPTARLPGQLRYFRELRERYSNSQERWADCELFGGAASGVTDVNLVQAEKLYAESRESTN